MIPAFSMSGESRIACQSGESRIACLSQDSLSVSRGSARHDAAFTPQPVHATTSKCIIPSYFEVMHLVLHACVWLHQGLHVNPTFLHDHVLRCRMSNPTQPDDVTSGSNVVNPPDTGCQGPTTRQQSTVDAMAEAAAAAAATQAAATGAQVASQGAQSMTASIDYHSLANAMSRLNDDSVGTLRK